jgi:hypothetical protein
MRKAYMPRINTVLVGLVLALQPFFTTSCQQTKALSEDTSVSKQPLPAWTPVYNIPPSELTPPADSDKKNLRYGFIDRNGQFVIEPKFKSVSCFKGGLAPVTTDAGDAYIDKSGHFVTKPGEYVTYHGGNCDDTWPNYAEDLHQVRKKAQTSSAKDSKSNPATQSYYGYVNSQGKLVVPLMPHFSTEHFSDGMARISDITNQATSDEIKVAEQNKKRTGYGSHGIRYGYIDTTGKIVVQPKFDKVEDFRWGIARIGINRYEQDPEYPNQKKAVTYYGFIDKKGRYLIEPTLTDVQITCNIVAEKLIKNSQSLMGKDALTKDSPAIKELCGTPKPEFRDGFATLDIPMPPSTTEMNYMLINQAGKKLFRGINMSGPGPYYQRVDRGINEGLALIKRDDGLKCYIDNQGNFVIPCKFKEAEVFTERLAAVAIEIDPKKK